MTTGQIYNPNWDGKMAERERITKWQLALQEQQAKNDFAKAFNDGQRISSGSVGGSNAGGSGDMYADAQKAKDMAFDDFKNKGDYSLKLRQQEFNQRQQAMEAAQRRQEDRYRNQASSAFAMRNAM